MFLSTVSKTEKFIFFNTSGLVRPIKSKFTSSGKKFAKANYKSEGEKELDAELEKEVEEGFKKRNKKPIQAKEIDEVQKIEEAVTNGRQDCIHNIRDYTSQCSEDFYEVGPFCFPSDNYNGPCKDEIARGLNTV
eukprot:GHVR01010385.1.p1 GENE.GHVR01010385.1~~GHVR01010385.1.p1  ORF type:complete len:134 (+),score=11.27 GHVR01010385.1:387-788(+)